MGTAIHGRAHGQIASLEVDGDTLRWRARRDAIAENIVTTIHDVTEARWIQHRVSYGGLACGAVAGWAVASDYLVVGVVAATAAGLLLAYRAIRPWRYLILALPNNQLLLSVDADSAATARELVARVRHVRASGEPPATPPMLP